MSSLQYEGRVDKGLEEAIENAATMRNASTREPQRCPICFPPPKGV